MTKEKKSFVNQTTESDFNSFGLIDQITGCALMMVC